MAIDEEMKKYVNGTIISFRDFMVARVITKEKFDELWVEEMKQSGRSNVEPMPGSENTIYYQEPSGKVGYCVIQVNPPYNPSVLTLEQGIEMLDSRIEEARDMKKFLKKTAK